MDPDRKLYRKGYPWTALETERLLREWPNVDSQDQEEYAARYFGRTAGSVRNKFYSEFVGKHIEERTHTAEHKIQLIEDLLVQKMHYDEFFRRLREIIYGTSDV